MQPTTSLTINALELDIHLGWRDDEQEKKQIIFLDVEIQYPTPPLACDSDKLEDTLCYASLVDKIRHELQTKKFRLIERVSKEIYQLIKPLTPPNALIQVCVTKYPHVQGLTNGVCFHYGDKP